MTRLKVGLVGASKIARKIFSTIDSSELFQVEAVASMSKSVAEIYENPPSREISFFDHYEKLFSSRSVAAVYISNLNSDHYWTIKSALNNGLHVLCEKPMTLSFDATNELLDLADQKSCLLMEGMMYTYHPQVRRVLELIQSGVLGEIEHFSGQFCFPLDTRGSKRRTLSGGGGAVADVGCYLIDFFNLIFDSPDSTVACTEFTRSPGEDVESHVAITLNSENGVTANLEAAINFLGHNTWLLKGRLGTISFQRQDSHGLSDPPIQICVGDKFEIIDWDRKGSPLDQFRLEFDEFARRIIDRDIENRNRRRFLSNSRILQSAREQIYMNVKRR